MRRRTAIRPRVTVPGREYQYPWAQRRRHRPLNVQTSTSNPRSPFTRRTISPFDPTDFGTPHHPPVTRDRRRARAPFRRAPFAQHHGAMRSDVDGPSFVAALQHLLHRRGERFRSDGAGEPLNPCEADAALSCRDRLGPEHEERPLPGCAPLRALRGVRIVAADAAVRPPPYAGGAQRFASSEATPYGRPARLSASVTRSAGSDTRHLVGDVVPVPADRENRRGLAAAAGRHRVRRRIVSWHNFCHKMRTARGSRQTVDTSRGPPNPACRCTHTRRGNRRVRAVPQARRLPRPTTRGGPKTGAHVLRPATRPPGGPNCRG